MALVLSWSESERALVVRALVGGAAAAAASPQGQARHALLLGALRVACQGAAFIVTDSGAPVLADLVAGEGAANEALAGTLLARLLLVPA